MSHPERGTTPEHEVLAAEEHASRRAVSRGMALGFLGVLAFSLTLPMTRLAVADIAPVWLAFGRAEVAAALAGSAVVLGFAFSRGSGTLSSGDLALLGAVAAGALGYGYGGMLSRHLGGWQTICWILVYSAPRSCCCQPRGSP